MSDRYSQRVQLSRGRLAAFALVVSVGAHACGSGGAQRPKPDSADALSCARLVGLELTETTITSSQPIPAGSFTPPGRSRGVEVPSFCRTVGLTAPAVNFEVWLPADWNGKFQGVGNGGMAGTISYDAMARALRRGYATASTDTGHKAGDVSFDASWALGRPDLIEDYGHRALHVTTVNAKAITAAYYGEPPRYAYYVGCSKGGQQGLMEAQRYPEDYDGLIAGNPANDWTPRATCPETSCRCWGRRSTRPAMRSTASRTGCSTTPVAAISTRPGSSATRVTTPVLASLPNRPTPYGPSGRE